MKKLLAMLLAGLLTITSMSVIIWADDEVSDDMIVGDVPGLEFDSLTELIEYIDWLDTNYSTNTTLNYNSKLIGYLYNMMDGVYLPDVVDIDEVKDVYVDPEYVRTSFRRDDEVLTLDSYVVDEDGAYHVAEYVARALDSGVVSMLGDDTVVYYYRYLSAGCYVFCQDGVYYQLINWTNPEYDETMLDYCAASYHTFGEAYNLEAESGASKVKLTWDEIVDDSTYTVYWKRSSSDEWNVACETSKHKVNIIGLKSGVSYDFKVVILGQDSEVVTATAE